MTRISTATMTITMICPVRFTGSYLQLLLQQLLLVMVIVQQQQQQQQLHFTVDLCLYQQFLKNNFFVFVFDFLHSPRFSDSNDYLPNMVNMTIFKIKHRKIQKKKKNKEVNTKNSQIKTTKTRKKKTKSKKLNVE